MKQDNFTEDTPIAEFTPTDKVGNVVITTRMIRDYCINHCLRWEEAKPLVNMAYIMLQGKGSPEDYDNLSSVTQLFKQRQLEPPKPLINTLPLPPLVVPYETKDELSDDMQLLNTMPEETARSVWDGIFHPAIDVMKVIAVLSEIDSPKVVGIKRWFVIHKVLEEINWLSDHADSHFIFWVEETFGWEWNTSDFKRVLPEFKRKSTLEWDKDTVKDPQTGISYRALADKVRNSFVMMKGDKIIDNTYFFKRPDLYIRHPANRRKP